MKILTPAKREFWVPPTRIFEYFGLNAAEETKNQPKVELWAMSEILKSYNDHPEQWTTMLPATKTSAKQIVAFDPESHPKWKWDAVTQRATNGLHGVATFAAEVQLNPDGTRTFMYDKVHRTNGKPSGKCVNGVEVGTQGAHTAPVIRDENTGNWYVGFFFQYRADMVWENEFGAWCAGVPGGYGLGDPTALALEELETEFGLRAVKSYVPMGYTNPDRAQWGDADQQGMAVFSISDVRELENQPDHEVILKSRYLVDIRSFPRQLDQYDSGVVEWARAYIIEGYLDI